MLRPLSASVFMCAMLIGSPGEAEQRPELFGNETSALAAVGNLGPQWRKALRPGRDLSVYLGPPPAHMRNIRQSSKIREFIFPAGRRVVLDWNRKGQLDQVGLFDPACWQPNRALALARLARFSGGSPDLKSLNNWANAIFDKNMKVVEVDAKGSFFQFLRFAPDKPCGVWIRTQRYGATTRV